MRNFSLPYGRGTLPFAIDETRLRAELRPQHTVGFSSLDEKALVQFALENPIDSPRLCHLARDKQHVLVITSDHTRPLPSAITLPLLLQEIRTGAPKAEIIILVATGVHRPTTDAELRAKLGDSLVESEKIVVHKAEEEENMAYFGTLPSGGELWLNKLAQWAELIVSEGFIEPHFFAGFSGGRKSILPGIAARKTVLYNHNAGFINNPGARQGSLEDNPIHQDMCFAAQCVNLQFILGVLLNPNKQIISAVAGHREKAHEAGCRQVMDMARCSPVPSDIVIVSNGGYPLDQNLYQCVKGLTAAQACVRQGGVIIMCAALEDGCGGDAFYQWFSTRDSADSVTRDIQSIPPGATQMDQWQAQILARVMSKASCIFVTGAENRDTVRRMHMHWAATPAQALALADSLVGKHAAVTIIPDGVGVIVG